MAETAIWGLFWWEDGQLAAPALEIGVLPGVARARITELVGTVQERKATVEEIRGKTLFVANSVRGVIPVASLDGAAVPSSEQTDALADRFWP